MPSGHQQADRDDDGGAVVVAGGAPHYVPGQPQLLRDPPDLDISLLERQVPGHRNQRHKGQ